MEMFIRRSNNIILPLQCCFHSRHFHFLVVRPIPQYDVTFACVLQWFQKVADSTLAGMLVILKTLKEASMELDKTSPQPEDDNVRT